MDSDQLAELRRRELYISREFGVYHAREVTKAIETGFYQGPRNQNVDWKREVVDAILAKRSIPPWQALPSPDRSITYDTEVQVTNETTVGAILRLIEARKKPLALNFANGARPGGGFLTGALAQEEAICRVSALYWTLVGDAMYIHHSYRERPDSTSWSILSPQVPIFASDNKTTLDKPVLADFITCAAPFADGPSITRQEASGMLRQRIDRVLRIATAFGYTTLVLGAWGCGAFGNDTVQTAKHFRNALEDEFAGRFSDIVFAISDWSTERKFLGPFRDVFTNPKPQQTLF
jgi:uncharacterized protein (TIGR02452 family)